MVGEIGGEGCTVVKERAGKFLILLFNCCDLGRVRGLPGYGCEIGLGFVLLVGLGFGLGNIKSWCWAH